MAMIVQLQLIGYNVAVWIEWVDSDSNSADSLSKNGSKILGHWISIEITRIPQPSFRSLTGFAARTILSRVVDH